MGRGTSEFAEAPVSTDRLPGPSSDVPWFTAQLETNSHGVHARLVGELDLASADQLTGLVAGLIDDGYRRVLLDLADLALCDARGLATLLAVQGMLQETGGALTITGASPIVRDVLELTRLTEVLDIE
jgi:anti-anti-sigma factor